MTSPAYPSFVGVALLVAVGVVALARASSRAVHPHQQDDADTQLPVVQDRALPTGALLLNVLLTQGVLIVVIGGLAWMAQIPVRTLGVGSVISLDETVVVGVGVGVVLYLLDELLTVVARFLGVVPAEALRESLSPASFRGWVTLLGGVLPVVAVAEELLFRGALIGVSTAGLGVPPGVAIGGSSVLFGAAHGVQGRGGIVVTGILGVALGIVFLMTENLLVVVIAHYLVNALEFLVHDAVDLSRWSESFE